jgi:hypothetical protein
MVRPSNAPIRPASSSSSVAHSKKSSFDPFYVEKTHHFPPKGAATVKRTVKKNAIKMTSKERAEIKYEVALKRDHKSTRFHNRGDAFKKPTTKSVVKKDEEGNETHKTVAWGHPALRKAPWKNCLMDVVKQYNGGEPVRISPTLQQKIGNDILTYRLAREVLPDAQQRRVDASPYASRDEMAKHFLIDTIPSRHLESAIRLNLTLAQKVNPGSVALQVFEETLAELTAETAAFNATSKERATEKARIKELIEHLSGKGTWTKLEAGRITDKKQKIELYAQMKELCALRLNKTVRNLNEQTDKLQSLKDAIKNVRTILPEAKAKAAELKQKAALATPPENDAEAKEQWDAEMAVLEKEQEKAETYHANRVKELSQLGERVVKLEEKIEKLTVERDALRKERTSAQTHLHKLEKQQEEDDGDSEMGSGEDEE